MSLNLNDRAPVVGSLYCTAPAYTDAVNDAQFVRTFGIVGLVGAILILLNPAVGIGIGAAVLGFGSTRYYRVLGIAVIALSIASIFLAPLRIIGSAVLAAGVAWKGVTILGVLSGVGKEDPDWQSTRKRAITGIILTVIAMVIDVAWLGLVLTGMLLGHK